MKPRGSRVGGINGIGGINYHQLQSKNKAKAQNQQLQNSIRRQKGHHKTGTYNHSVTSMSSLINNSQNTY